MLVRARKAVAGKLRARSSSLTGACAALLAAGFLAYPYVTLYRLGAALSAGDATLLAHLVDWDSVRDGIKEDICDAVTEVPATTVAQNNVLPPFGFSFVRGVASNLIDTNVNPDNLVSATQSAGPALRLEREMLGLRWAFFDSPSSFTVAYHAPGQQSGEPGHAGLAAAKPAGGGQLPYLTRLDGG
jgi:hypothetical protein